MKYILYIQIKTKMKWKIKKIKKIEKKMDPYRLVLSKKTFELRGPLCVSNFYKQ